MAPPRTKKQQKSTDSASTSQHNGVPQVSTPQHSPQRTAMRITAAQKQALIDNLQLEVTERARKLRAQYSLQAQSLRTRIEMRVNRIPTALRKANIGELYAKYEEIQMQEQAAAASKDEFGEVSAGKPQSQQHVKPYPSKSRGKKRNSDAMEEEGKDRVKIHEDPIPNPKKRTKVTKGAESRTAPNPSTVLSPKSANSRTLPQSPVRYDGDAPQKNLASRATSPLKPALPTGKKGAAAATATLESLVNGTKGGQSKAKAGKAAPTKRQPKPAPESEGLRTISSTSNSSAFSTGTTIVKPTRKAPTATAKSVKKVAGVRTAPAKKIIANAEAPAKGRRVLRTRA